MRIGIIGCGNVGFNTALAFHRRGHHEVYGHDISKRQLRRFSTHLPGRAVSRVADLKSCDAVFVCVPTDPRPDSGGADLSAVEDVVAELAAVIRSPGSRISLVVQRSTCPPGTADALAALVEPAHYSVNPSFLSKRTQWEDTDRPPRIAFSGSDEARALMRSAYLGFEDSPLFECADHKVMELLKYTENAIDSVLISLWNELLALSDGIGVTRRDFVALMEHLPDRPRFGTCLRVPGQAFGNWCLPKDLAALRESLETAGVPHGVVSGAIRTNHEMAEQHGVNGDFSGDLVTYREGRSRLTEHAVSRLLRSAPEHLSREPG